MLAHASALASASLLDFTSSADRRTLICVSTYLVRSSGLSRLEQIAKNSSDLQGSPQGAISLLCVQHHSLDAYQALKHHLSISGSGGEWRRLTAASGPDGSWPRAQQQSSSHVVWCCMTLMTSRSLMSW